MFLKLRKSQMCGAVLSIGDVNAHICSYSKAVRHTQLASLMCSQRFWWKKDHKKGIIIVMIQNESMWLSGNYVFRRNPSLTFFVLIITMENMYFKHDSSIDLNKI